jgi:hypothetical protein
MAARKRFGVVQRIHPRRALASQDARVRTL